MAKRKYKRKALHARIGELASKERQRRNCGVVLEVVDRNDAGAVIIKRHRARSECVLDAYFIRETITNVQYEAGLRFRAAYMRAVLGLHVYELGTGARGDNEMAYIMPLASERVLKRA